MDAYEAVGDARRGGRIGGGGLLKGGSMASIGGDKLVGASARCTSGKGANASLGKEIGAAGGGSVTNGPGA